jgi:hypothetical protein
MAGKYYQFSKKHFEYEMRGILIRNKCGFMTDITEEWIKEGNETWERIYKIQTKNRAVDLIVFSSVDMRTNEVRDNGSDAVRLVMRWTTKNGHIYRKIAKHYRLETLFKNVEKSIKEATSSVFQLNYKEFVPEWQKAI